MIRNVASLVLVGTLALSGCGADPAAACTAYLDAALACAQEAHPDNSEDFALPESTCDAYNDLSGSAGADAADLLDCYAETINAGDCSTPEAYSDTMASITSACL